MNTSVEAVDVLINKMKTLDNKLTKSKADMKGVTKLASTLGNRLDELNKQMKDVLKRVQKLEKWQLNNDTVTYEDSCRKRVKLRCLEKNKCDLSPQDSLGLEEKAVNSSTNEPEKVGGSLRAIEQTTRQQESGIISQRVLNSVCLIFESLPIWLFGLDNFNVGKNISSAIWYICSIHPRD